MCCHRPLKNRKAAAAALLLRVAATKAAAHAGSARLKCFMRDTHSAGTIPGGGSPPNSPHLSFPPTLLGRRRPPKPLLLRAGLGCCPQSSGGCGPTARSRTTFSFQTSNGSTFHLYHEYTTKKGANGELSNHYVEWAHVSFQSPSKNTGVAYELFESAGSRTLEFYQI
jgi:hypothetical protein